MKLYFYRHEGAENFGDDLNDWLWKELLPRLWDDDETDTFIGFGTLLNERLHALTPNAKRRFIFSTGYGYGKGMPDLGPSDAVYCVRGPLTARVLRLPEDRAVTDGAILVRRVYRSDSKKRYRFAFMPHLDEIAAIGWTAVCEELGIAFIDPRWPSEKTLPILSETEVLLAEAMHGAIVADALRIPWIPVVTSDRILRFKWDDWCQSMGLVYNPVRITAQVDPRPVRDLLTPVRKLRYQILRSSAIAELTRLMEEVRPLLSAESMVEDRTQQLEERLERLTYDAKQSDQVLVSV